MKEKIYDLPKYYDIGWSWDNSWEINLFLNLFDLYVPFEVKNLLEPACGTGRFLTSLPNYKYHITGYDINPIMVNYAKKKIDDAGLNNIAEVISGDMSTIKFDTKFDSAINSINSIGYLLSDNDIVSHLRNTAESLKTGGIYIIHLNCALDDLKLPEEINWVCERDGIQVKVTWGIEKYDRAKKLNYEYSKLDILDHGEHITVEDRHVLRLWFYDDLKNLINESGNFTLEAIYDDNKGKQISLDTNITGEFGNLFYVLKVS